MKCVKCKRTYPDHLIAPMFVANRYIMAICPICALKIRNKMHGLKAGTPFHGEIASNMWLEATRLIRKRAKRVLRSR